MRRPQFLISAAWLLNGAAWFLPAVTSVGGGAISPITGVWAFLFAARTAWPDSAGYYHDALLAALSVFTTVFFIIVSPWAVFRGTRSLRRISAWVAAAAFLFNTHWYIRLTPNGWWISGLGIGYFLWWLSFAVLAIGLFDLAGQNNAAESALTHTALLPR